MQHILKCISAFTIVLILFSCNKKIDQNTMFKGREHKSKKRGVYDAGMNRHEGFKTPPSVQTAKAIDKLSKYDKNPRKAARKANKEMEKKKRASQKARDKYNKKRHVKVKTTKGKTGGDK